MKRKVLLIAAIAATVILSSCGMKVEEIDPALTNLTSAYQGGAYEQAETLVKDLKKAYRKMSDEQKSKFDELKPEVEYAISTVDAIYNDFNNAQDLYDKKMYYESSQALDKLSADYTLPPTEQKKYDEKKADVDAAIKRLKVNEAFKKVESAYNGGDYDLASNELSVIDTSSMSDEQKEIQQTWQKKINASKSFVQAESDYNNGNYSSALSILYGIDTTYLAADQSKKWSELKDQATAAERRVNSVQKAIDIAKQYRPIEGTAQRDDYFGMVYSAIEHSDYYLVKVITTRNANGQDRYKVYKSSGDVEYLGCASDDANWANEENSGD